MTVATYSAKDYTHAKRVEDGAIVKVPASWLKSDSPYSDSFRAVKVKRRAEPEPEDSEEGSEDSEESSEEQQEEETPSPRRRRNRK